MSPQTVQGNRDKGTHRQRKERKSTPRYAPTKTWKTAESAENFRTSKPCTFCDRKHPSECKFKDHPDANTDPSIPWLESSRARDEQGRLRELRLGLQATLGLGKKRNCTSVKSSIGTPDNHRCDHLMPYSDYRSRGRLVTK